MFYLTPNFRPFTSPFLGRCIMVRKNVSHSTISTFILRSLWPVPTWTLKLSNIWQGQHLVNRPRGNSWCCWNGFTYQCELEASGQSWIQAPLTSGYVVLVVISGRASPSNTNIAQQNNASACQFIVNYASALINISLVIVMECVKDSLPNEGRSAGI